MTSINLLLKPSSSNCNLRCDYCFYFDEASHRSATSFGFMSESTVDAITRKALAFSTERCEIGFQGGEPMLAGKKWFERFIASARANNVNGAKIGFSIQTNGTLIDDEWARFFAENGFLVGVSLDGPRKYHDSLRRDTRRKGTFDRVMKGLDALRRNGADFNILTVVTERTARNIEEIYRFFMDNGFVYQQYIPCLDPVEASTRGSRSLSSPLYARFLKKLFDVWYEDRKAGKLVYNRYFENLAGLMLGLVPESCNMRGICSRQYAIEADGGVYPCDFYMMDDYKLGNICANSLEEIDARRLELGFIERSRELPGKCRSCRWYSLCHGGCYRERTLSGGGTVPLNRYCDALRDFFAYAAPRLRALL